MDGADCQLLELLHADDPAAAGIHWRARAEPLLEEDAGAALAIRYLDLHFPGWRDECPAGGDPGPDSTSWTARTGRLRLRIIQRRRRGIVS